MDERVIKRGEVYWLPDDDVVGYEKQKVRPAVVVSGDSLNMENKTVIVALMTSTAGGEGSARVLVRSTGRDSYVCCDEVKTIDKRRLMGFVGSLNAEEMFRIKGALAVCFCLTPPRREENRVDDTKKLQVELDIAKGMYQEVLRQLIELRVSADIGTNDKIESIDDEIDSIEEPVKGESEDRVVRFLTEPERTADINTATETELRGVGCTPEISRRIIESRPYESVDELKKFNWMTRMGFQLVKGRLTCTPVVIEKPVVKKTKVEPPVEVKPQGKIDINTAGGKEISDFLGCPTYHAYAITSYRKNNGNFVCLEELNDIKKIPKDFLEKYGEFLTIGEEEPEVTEVTEVEESGMTLDINTASTRDFMDVGFGKREAALIVSERKKFGNFKNVEDLSEIPGVTGKILRKLKDVLYVESSGSKPYYVG